MHGIVLWRNDSRVRADQPKAANDDLGGSMSPEPQQEIRFKVEIPPELRAGQFASFANIWHGSDSFTLDFATVVQPPVSRQDEETGASYIEVASQVVARVRIPPAQVFEIMKALEQQLTAWEAETGNAPSGPTGQR